MGFRQGNNKYKNSTFLFSKVKLVFNSSTATNGFGIDNG